MDRKKNICVVTSDVPMVHGGHRVIADSLVTALQGAGCEADVVFTAQNRFGRQFSAYLSTRLMDVGMTGDGRAVDGVISMRFPAFAVRHRNHICWLNHRMREYYDLWPDFYRSIQSFPARVKENIRRRLIWRADGYLLRRNVKKLFAQSETIRDRLKQWGGLESEVLYPPAPIRLYRRSGYENFIFCVSRLSPLKRVDILVRAFYHLRDKELRCVIAGEGPERAKLEKMIEAEGLKDRVTLVGRIDDERLVEHLSRCLAVYYGPKSEDYGLVTLEAYASGKPVITLSDSGGPTELVRDGETGFICPVSPEAVAARLDILAGQPGQAAVLGEAGYQSTLKINWEAVVKRFLSEMHDEQP
jgi:glycosyltransferase involved in cell wall biosynthesis